MSSISANEQGQVQMAEFRVLYDSQEVIVFIAWLI
jgi:hypothetical protein